MKLRAAVHEVCCLSSDDRRAMFQLMEQSYANMRWDRFNVDLDAKPWVILVRSLEDRIVGFSTQSLLESDIDGVRIRALYSGDTVVDRGHWGDPALAHAWGNFALELIERNVSVPFYWFLTSKGFRTYRYLPLFFREFYPRPNAQIPEWESAVVDALGRAVGGGRFDAVRKIIRAEDDREFVRGEIADPGMRWATDANIRFFIEQNSGFARGDELCCLAPLTRENFTRAANRVIHKPALPLAFN